MDERDCRLLIELMRTPFDSFERIGRRLSIKGKTAKLRLDRLREVGILQGFVCGPSPQSLGMQSRLALYLDRPIACDARDLPSVPGVVWSAQTYPTATSALLYTPHGGELPNDLEVHAGRAPDAVFDITGPTVASSDPLSPLDWRVLQAVMPDPRASLRDIAAACGLTPRTVRERRDRMLHEGNLFAFPALDATNEQGTILYGAYVRTQQAEQLKVLRLANAWRLNEHHDPPAVFVYGYVRTYSEARAVERKMKGIPGATEVHFTVPQGTYGAPNNLNHWVAEKLAMWEKAVPGLKPGHRS